MPTRSRPAPAAAEPRAATCGIAVHRFEVRPAPGLPDPTAESVRRDAQAMGVHAESVSFARVYLVRAALSAEQAQRVARRLLANPVTEAVTSGSAGAPRGVGAVEVFPQPGVMDPAAQTVRDAVRELTGVRDVEVVTGRRYEFAGVSPADADRVARRLLANPVIHDIHVGAFHPAEFPRGSAHEFRVRQIPIRELDDAGLTRLSREAHLFLSPEEMRAIRDEFRRLQREPSDIELETLAQTWSEHCVHKTLKSRVLYRGPRDDAIVWRGRPGVSVQPDGSVVIDNLLRSTVAAATHELIADGVDWTLSVFKDNAGVIAFDDAHAVCVKVETHNHPSAIEPYGGAATGVGGCVRDVIGTGLGARPIANTDVFCVAPPDLPDVPAGCIPPRRILKEVVAGVRDYGNRMGIPTVNGAVCFDERYVGNPLVFCGSVGDMPRDRVKGAARAGDRIVAIGGRRGRDGIPGATFSSAELTETHADEFAHAVQIGNAIEEKKVLDAVLRARDASGGPLFHAITDCGAGGFSSAVGEMGADLGAEVDLDRAPLKYDGLTYTEIWISEAQERMVLAVPAPNLERLRAICNEEHVEANDLGVFGAPGRDLVLRYNGTEVGRLPMAFLHEGLPQPMREAVWRPRAPAPGGTGKRLLARALKGADSLNEHLLRLLSHPNIASKRWIVRQYDHEVHGNLVINPLVGPLGDGPGDASVLEPVPGTGRGLAIACGLATDLGDPALGGDPYFMALAAVDECVRNLVCVGADPDRTAILDNFCWPSCAKPENLGSLVRAAVGCYDASKAYRTPFVSGKDSLNNQFTTEDGRTIEIPPTLLISGIGIVPDIARCVTRDAQAPGNAHILVGDTSPPAEWARRGPATARAVAALIHAGLVRSAHDCSEGGLLVAVAEMCLAAMNGVAIGAELDAPGRDWFEEAPGRYVLEIDEKRLDEARRAVGDTPHAVIGRLNDAGRLRSRDGAVDVSVEECRAAFLRTLDW